MNTATVSPDTISILSDVDEVIIKQFACITLFPQEEIKEGWKSSMRKYGKILYFSQTTHKSTVKYIRKWMNVTFRKMF